MKEKIGQCVGYFRKMSPLKKVSIVFAILLIFIIIVEQPGKDTSGRSKGVKFFVPKMVIEYARNINIHHPDDSKSVMLEKKDKKWIVANGHSLPADENKIADFLKAVHSLEEGALVSRNQDRMGIFSVDEKNGIRVRISDHKQRVVADFFAGEIIPDGQYLRHADSYEVYQTIPSLLKFLRDNAEGWKDKTFLSVNSDTAHRVSLKTPEGEVVLEKDSSGKWFVIQPEDHEADELAIRTLFDQLKQVRADSFTDSVEGSQADFENPDYKISARNADDSLNVSLFSYSGQNGIYYAKNPDMNFIYSVSKDLIDNIFGLDFKPGAQAE